MSISCLEVVEIFEVVGHLSIPLALLKSWHSVHVEPIVVHVVGIHVVVVHGVHVVVVHIVVVHGVHMVVVHGVHVIVVLIVHGVHVVHIVGDHGPVVTPVGVVYVSVLDIGLSNSEGGETDQDNNLYHGSPITIN